MYLTQVRLTPSWHVVLGLARHGAGVAPDARVLIDEESVPRHVSLVVLRLASIMDEASGVFQNA